MEEGVLDAADEALGILAVVDLAVEPAAAAEGAAQQMGLAPSPAVVMDGRPGAVVNLHLHAGFLVQAAEGDGRRRPAKAAEVPFHAGVAAGKGEFVLQILEDAAAGKPHAQLLPDEVGMRGAKRPGVIFKRWRRGAGRRFRPVGRIKR